MGVSWRRPVALERQPADLAHHPAQEDSMPDANTSLITPQTHMNVPVSPAMAASLPQTPGGAPPDAVIISLDSTPRRGWWLVEDAGNLVARQFDTAEAALAAGDALYARIALVQYDLT
jgi:hypothetical protein